MRTTPVAAALLSLATAGSLLVASPAAAATGTVLRVTGPAGTFRLYCDPVRGTHPWKAQACAELAAANGRVADVPALPAACTMIWAPVQITVRGYWQGKVVSFRATESNASCAEISHSHIFLSAGSPLG